MYSIKQAMLLSGSLPMADLTLYYMDIRAFGKGYEQFYQNAKAMGINFVKGKVARIEPVEDGDLALRVEHEEDGGRVMENRHDLVVLAQGMVPEPGTGIQFSIELGSDGFVRKPDSTRPAWAGVDGVFVAGAAGGPKDIVDSIIEASAAAMEASRYLTQTAASAAAVVAQPETILQP
jgi:heterodisulfide reductase subunit A